MDVNLNIGPLFIIGPTYSSAISSTLFFFVSDWQLFLLICMYFFPFFNDINQHQPL